MAEARTGSTKNRRKPRKPVRKQEPTAAQRLCSPAQESDVTYYVNPWSLIPSEENATLYHDPDPKDTSWLRFVESIRRGGVQAPILVSLDNYIISGHRRTAGAKAALLDKVPIIVKGIRRSDYTDDQWLAILREHNTGREKSVDELIREKIVDIDPNEACNAVLADKINRQRPRLARMKLCEERVTRSRISDMKQQFAEAILQVFADLEDFLPASIRQVHYNLLKNPPLRNSRKKCSRYKNDRASYSDLSDMVTRMRFNGTVNWDWVHDETRSCTEWRMWKNASSFVEAQTSKLFKEYSRDLLQSQPNHIEIICEKLTVKGIVEDVARNYRIPVFIGRGNSSTDSRYRLAERMRESGKRGLTLLVLGDCDPDGDSICESFVRSMRDEFYLENVEGIRVGITHQQADELDLPDSLEAKESSPNYKKFAARHGRTDAYELEAVSPTVLQEWTADAILGVLDMQLFNAEVERQKQEAVEIAARRQAVMERLKAK